MTNDGGGLKVVGIFVTIISTLIGGYVSCHNQQVSVDQKKMEITAQEDLAKTQEDLQNGLAKAQENLQASKISNEHEKDELARLDTEEKASEDFADKNTGQYWVVKFKNSCNEEVDIAVRYQALNGQTVVKGWMVVPPNEEKTPLFTSSRWFEWYAYDSKGHVWTGDAAHLVTSEMFTYIDDYYFRAGWMKLPGAPEEVKFLQEQISMNDYGTFTQGMTCSQ